MIPVVKVEKPSMMARTPSRVPCKPLASIMKPIPSSIAQDAERSFHITLIPVRYYYPSGKHCADSSRGSGVQQCLFKLRVSGFNSKITDIDNALIIFEPD